MSVRVKLKNLTTDIIQKGFNHIVLGCVKVPKVKNSILSRAFPIPFDPSNMRNLQKFPSEIV